MELQGRMKVARPADRVVAAMNEPAVLQAILPSCTGVRPVGPGRFVATVTRKLGPLSISVEPEIEVTSADDRSATLSIRAANRLAGTVASEITLNMAPAGGGTEVAWNGTLTATGLALRMMSERSERVRVVVQGLFNQLKDHIERRA